MDFRQAKNLLRNQTALLAIKKKMIKLFNNN